MMRCLVKLLAFEPFRMPFHIIILLLFIEDLKFQQVRFLVDCITKSRLRLFIAVIFVAVTSECRLKWVICKTWTGILTNRANTDQTPQNATSDQCLHCLL